MKPRRALVLFFEEGEPITGEALRVRLESHEYAIVDRPAVMRGGASQRHILGLISMPDDALEADKRQRLPESTVAPPA